MRMKSRIDALQMMSRITFMEGNDGDPAGVLRTKFFFDLRCAHSGYDVGDEEPPGHDAVLLYNPAVSSPSVCQIGRVFWVRIFSSISDVLIRGTMSVTKTPPVMTLFCCTIPPYPPQAYVSLRAGAVGTKISVSAGGIVIIDRRPIKSFA